MDTATILVVCSGNVRRSPAIEAMLREGVGQIGGLARHGINVISAGSEALEGYEMDPMIASEVALAGTRLTRIAGASAFPDWAISAAVRAARSSAASSRSSE